MKAFTVFDSASGEKLRQGMADDIHAQAHENEVVLEGHFDAETHVFRRGKARRRNTGQRSERALKRLWRTIRVERNQLLRRHVDGITAIQLQTMSDEETAAVHAYRTALLNITDTHPDPRTIIWPEPPVSRFTKTKGDTQ